MTKRRYRKSTIYELRQALLEIDSNCQSFIDSLNRDTSGLILAQICQSAARRVLFVEEE